MLKLLETLSPKTQPPRFIKVERVEYDLACPHCGAKMGEKDYSFGFEDGLWYHACDGKTKMLIRPTEEQEKRSASFSSWLKGGLSSEV